MIGKRIVVNEQEGELRAGYGEKVLTELASQLTLEFGSGFSERYLRAFRQFYIFCPDYENWKSRFPNLTWTHFRLSTFFQKKSQNICTYIKKALSLRSQMVISA